MVTSKAVQSRTSIVDDPVIPKTVQMSSISLYQAGVFRSGMGLGARNFCSQVCGCCCVVLLLDVGSPGLLFLDEENQRCLVVFVGGTTRRGADRAKLE